MKFLLMAGLLVLTGCGKASGNYSPAGVYIVSTTTAPEGLKVIQAGNWSGQGIQMQVSSSGLSIQFDSAAGQVSSGVTLDMNSSFHVNGTYTLSSAAQASPVVYSGWVDSTGRLMTLQIDPSTAGAAVQSFELRLQ